MWSACMWFQVRGSLGSASPDLGENTAVLMGNENSKPSNQKRGYENTVVTLGPRKKVGEGGGVASLLNLTLFLSLSFSHNYSPFLLPPPQSGGV